MVKNSRLSDFKKAEARLPYCNALQGHFARFTPIRKTGVKRTEVLFKAQDGIQPA